MIARSEVGSVTDVVHEAYRSLNLAYRQIGEDQTTDRSKAAYSPVVLGAVEGSEQAVARETLVEDLNDIIGHTAARIGEHLAALSSLYLPSPEGVYRDHPIVQDAENQRSPRSAAFTLARGILEGVSMFAWVAGLDSDQDERLRRTASISIWSAHFADRANGSTLEEGARRRGKAANVGVIPKLTQTTMIKDSLGSDGLRLYSRWSGRAHHAPWAGVPALLRKDHGHLVAYSSALEQPAHLELAADVAKLIHLQLDLMIDVLGKKRFPLVDELPTLEKYLRRASNIASTEVAKQGVSDSELI